MGHGSHLSPESSAPVYAHAATIRSLGLFDEVVEAFWKEEPALPFVLGTVTAEEIWVVPIFLAEGYFTRQVIPREMGLDVPLTIRDGRTIHYCAPIGTHPLMAAMILQRARSASGLSAAERRHAALLIIGHGTERSATSGDTVYRLVEQMRAGGEFGQVDCGFLDEEPGIAGVLDGVAADDVILVPFFVADGWHTATTIPKDLALDGAVTRRGSRTIWYTPPVGTLLEIAGVILALAESGSAAAQESQQPIPPPHRAGAHPGLRESGEPISGDAAPRLQSVSAVGDCEAFLAWIDSRPDGAVYLQLRITPLGSGRYEARHLEDVAAEPRDLESSSDPETALEIARYTAEGEYRPLRTAATLRRGWLLDLDAEGLWRAISLFYPATVVHWLHPEQAEERSRSYEQWARRQTGIYTSLHDLPPELLPQVVEACCVGGRCMRTRLWRYDTTLSPGPAATAGGSNGIDSLPVIPCPEPCTLFGSIAREILYASTTCEGASDLTP